MKKLILTIFCVSSVLLKAQGLIYIKDSSDQREEIPVNRSTLASEKDYTAYTPLNYQQFGSTCVAHAFAKARAILLNKKLGETDDLKKLAHNFSPYFLYFSLTSPLDYQCSQGLNIEVAARWTLSYGLAPMIMVEYPNFYPFTVYTLGSPYPNRYPADYRDDASMAANFKFTKIYRLNDVFQVKQALHEGMAVVVGMQLTEEFVNLKSSTYTYSSYHTPVAQGHAMVVVGYSDYYMGGAFKIANSWGSTWGDNGFVWVNYNTFKSMFKVAYGCSDQNEDVIGSASNISSANKAVYGYHGDSIFQAPMMDTSSAKGQCKITSKEMKSLKKRVSAPKKYMIDIIDKLKQD